MIFSLRLWLRTSRLERALVGYPQYDPPHKVEERLLSREAAAENFDYFMRVRLDRLAYFQTWLREQFGFRISLDEKGILAFCRWRSKYAGFLLTKGPDGYPTDSYFTYSPRWNGENIGHNVVFDTGIFLGEAILANCPKLRWDFDPTSAVLPKSAKELRETPGMSFWRPAITGFDNPAYRVSVLHKAYEFSSIMMNYTTSVEGWERFNRLPRFQRSFAYDAPLNLYRTALKNYPEGDPSGFMREMGQKDYLEMIDNEQDEENSDE
jgi:hypothetical protein